jgi:hypothetical protein
MLNGAFIQAFSDNWQVIFPTNGDCLIRLLAYISYDIWRVQRMDK